jgi:hypothetical protein
MWEERFSRNRVSAFRTIIPGTARGNEEQRPELVEQRRDKLFEQSEKPEGDQ